MNVAAPTRFGMLPENKVVEGQERGTILGSITCYRTFDQDGVGCLARAQVTLNRIDQPSPQRRRRFATKADHPRIKDHLERMNDQPESGPDLLDPFLHLGCAGIESGHEFSHG